MISMETAVIAGFIIFFIFCFGACVFLFAKYAKTNKKLEEAEAEMLTLAASIENHSDQSQESCSGDTPEPDAEDHAPSNADTL